MQVDDHGSSLPVGRFEGREAFRQLVRDAFTCAVREGWPEMVLCDADFGDWPLGEPQVVEQLHQWSGHRRSLTILAANFDVVSRMHPRFVQWRVRWDHLIVARKVRAIGNLDVPSVLWSGRWALQRLDPVRSNGVTVHDAERLARQREQIDEWLQSRSAPGFPASVLGL